MSETRAHIIYRLAKIDRKLSRKSLSPGKRVELGHVRIILSTLLKELDACEVVG